MTSNQRRVIRLATQILEDEHFAAKISDPEWELLLLAAGLNNVSARPSMVAHLVLHNLAHADGYFSSSVAVNA
jgi:hypothetical protein